MLLDEYVIMPNHMHGIIILRDCTIEAQFRRGEVPSPQQTKGDETSPRRERVTLGSVIAYYKYVSTKMMNEFLGTPGERRWQRSYYEHIVRDDRDLERIRRYIEDNPLGWGTDAEQLRIAFGR